MFLGRIGGGAELVKVETSLFANVWLALQSLINCQHQRTGVRCFGTGDGVLFICENAPWSQILERVEIELHVTPSEGSGSSETAKDI